MKKRRLVLVPSTALCTCGCHWYLSLVVWQVKVAAITSAIHCLPFLTAELRRSRVLPLLRSMYQAASSRNISLASSTGPPILRASALPVAQPLLSAVSTVAASVAPAPSPTTATRRADAVQQCLATNFGAFFSTCRKLGDFSPTGVSLFTNSHACSLRF